MNRDNYNPSSYDKKIKELHGKVEIEAKKLQDVVDSTITAKTELAEQVERKARLNREIKVLNEKIEEAGNALQQFSEKTVSRLNTAEKELKDERVKLEEFRKEVQEEMKNLDSTKTYLTDLYGKLAMYVIKAQDMIEYSNDYLEKHGVPIKFQIPDGEIIEVNLDNFNL